MSAITAATRLIIRFEGFRARPYRDATGCWTIGYGQRLFHAPAPGLVWSRRHARLALRHDLRLLDRPLRAMAMNAHQRAAVLDFIYNVGWNAWRHSTLRRCILEHHWRRAAAQFGRWVYAGGRILPGLVRRRNAEKKLFEEHGKK